jgi:hypothetical protein
MQFLVYRVPQEFVPISDFRDRYALPQHFGVSAFLPKDFTGLASIELAGDALKGVRQAVLDAIPESAPTQGWMGFNLRLQLRFQRALKRANEDIGLKPSEIQYAVAGFGDVIQAYLHLALRRRLQSLPPPGFASVYANWLNESIEVARLMYPYNYQGEIWLVRLVRNAYGRMGMLVQMQGADHYVYDAEQRCPAAGFMASMLEAAARRLAAALQTETQQERK